MSDDSDPSVSLFESNTEDYIADDSLEETMDIKITRFIAIFISFFVFSAIFIASISKDKTPEYSVLYFNDIHVDPEYIYTRSYKSHCHKEENGTGHFKFGQYGCDTTKELLDSFLNILPKKVINPQIIIIGGDISCTWTYNTTHKIIQDNLYKIIKSLRNSYPRIPVLLNMGNGEYLPNYGTFETDHKSFQNVAEILDTNLDDSMKETFLGGGFYSYTFNESNMKFISFNSVIYNKKRPYTFTDPYGQFSWLEKELNTTLKTVLMFHIQPGVAFAGKTSGWHYQYIEKFTNILLKNPPDYVFSAHTHLDLLMPVFSHIPKLHSIAMSSPSISPSHGGNPAFRVYKIKNNELIDYEQYYADIKDNPSELKWKLEYKFSQAYRQPNLNFESLKSTLNWIQTSDQGMWKYQEHVYARAFQHSDFFQCLNRATTEIEMNDCMEQFPNRIEK